MAEYKKCKAIDRLTPEIIREWDSTKDDEIFIVKKQVFFKCPKTDNLVQQGECLSCNHFYGWSSEKWIYCLPYTEKQRGIRSMRKENEMEEVH